MAHWADVIMKIDVPMTVAPKPKRYEGRRPVVDWKARAAALPNGVFNRHQAADAWGVKPLVASDWLHMLGTMNLIERAQKPLHHFKKVKP